MILEVILFKALEIGIPIVVERVGKDFYRKLNPPIKKATRSAIKKMRVELGSKISSINFGELKFQFDSPEMRNELNKLTSGRELPDENILRQEMAREVAEKWPSFSDKAETIVNSFLNHFEKECLASEELKGVALASIIRGESTAIQEFVYKDGERTRKEIFQKIGNLECLIASKSTTQETETIKITSTLEERLLQERDEFINLVKKWQSIGLFGKIKKLAEDAFNVREHISPAISGSIFRLFGSFILRSTDDYAKAKYWIDLAAEIEPNNQKTIALKAELLCMKKSWNKAKGLLDPLAESSTESLVKIIYAECLSHVLDVQEAFKWLKKHEGLTEDDDIKLNLAIFAVKCGACDYALDIIKKLKEKPYPGPYPYLLTSEILINQTSQKDFISISAPEDIEIQRNYRILNEAIDNLKKSIELLELMARPSKEIAHTAHSLSEIYLTIEDVTSAEKYLCRYWKQLRKQSNPWFTASSIVAVKRQKNKALARGQKALEISKENDKKSLCRYALLCMNIEEWDKCLETINSIKLDQLDEEHQKATIQMELICYFYKGDIEHTEKALIALKNQFPEDEQWVIHKSIILNKLGKTQDAINLLIKESLNFPNSLKIKCRLASLYRQNKRYSDALPLYKEIANFSGNPKSFETACWAAFDSNNPDEVISIINDAERRNAISDNLKHLRAIALTINKQYDKALDLFLAFTDDSLNSDDYIFCAYCYENRAKPEDAINLLNKAKLKYPNDIRILRRLYFLYLEINKPEKAFEEALILLKKNPEDKEAYFAVMNTGFAIGREEIAHETMMEYLSRFGEGPELKSGKYEDVKDLLKVSSEKTQFLWGKYQDGLLPEVILAQGHALGMGGNRIMLLESSARVMAFDGDSDSQKRQLLDTLTEKNILIDYHALITIYLLDLIEPTLSLYPYINIPEIALHKLKEDLIRLSTSYQKDRRCIQEGTFSKIKNTFEIHETFPQINPKDIPESIGNAIYDLMICKEKNCTYVTSGFDRKELSDIKSFFNIVSISVLDIADLMKEKGIITVKKHEDVIEILKKYNLKRLRNAESIPCRFVFDWHALEMFEECKILEYISKLTDERHIGPFSYTVLQSDIGRYKIIDKIQNILKNIEGKLSELHESGKLKIIACSTKGKNIQDNPSQEVPGLEYIEEIKNICKENQFILWTDDLGSKVLSTNDVVKTTCTRTILDAFLNKEIINKEYHLQKIVQILKWNMYFCWINSDLILKCAEIYDYSISDDLMVIIGSLTNEIQNYLGQIPNKIKHSNFDVASICMQKLWIISKKAQGLAMRLFDEIHAATKAKEVLDKFWISKCILDFASIGNIPLSEFLKMLSLRMAEQIDDKLKNILVTLIIACLKNRMELLAQTAGTKVASNIINAVKVAVPSYKDELIKLALKLNPSLRILI